jgi:predicted type IV restriction endonuclease
MHDLDSCRANLDKLVHYAKTTHGTRNEATTRLQLIDSLFFDCLGWSKDDVILEESHSGEYADYAFVFPRRLLIVEAKKEGAYFELPVSHERHDLSLTSLTRSSTQLKSAIEQVTGYCQKRGVPYAAVCNGRQIVAFIASRSDGVPPMDGRAIVITLWNVLSKDGIENQSLATKLLGHNRPVLPPKLSASLKPYPGTKARNPFQTSIKSLSEFILEDLPKAKQLEQAFLRDCYLPGGTLSQYSLQNKRILQARYSMLFDEERPGPSVSDISDGLNLNPEVLAQSFSRRPILLIGDVGVGKTTFIRYLMFSDSMKLRDKAISIYIDLGTKGTLVGDLRQYIIDELEGQLRDSHEIDITESTFVNDLYRGELDRFEKGIHAKLKTKRPSVFEEKRVEFLEGMLAKRDKHIQYSLARISRELKKQVVIFLDNTDQRSEADQQAAFLIAQEMADQWDSMIYVTLRPETFHASTRRGALTGYHPKAFTVAPPRIDRVIQRRLLFGLKVAGGKYPPDSSLQAARNEIGSLEILLKVFLRSIRQREDVLTCVDNIAAGNVRMALELVKSFFGSGHVDTQKIVTIVQESGGYTIPVHEFQRAIIYGDSTHYDPTRSPVANLFDVAGLDEKEHFLQPIMLDFLRKPAAARSPEGFFPIEVVYENLQHLRFTPEQIDFAVMRLFKKRLIETSARRIPEPGSNAIYAVRITSAGLYHLDGLLPTFTYYDAVVVDTPILKKANRDLIRDAHTLEDRLQRASQFIQYLDSCWKALESESGFSWGESSDQAKELIERLFLKQYGQRKLTFSEGSKE